MGSLIGPTLAGGIYDAARMMGNGSKDPDNRALGTKYYDIILRNGIWGMGYGSL